MLPPDESRYARQIQLPQIGKEGQQKLLDSRALIIGLGGLGSPAALYLAAAGVGELVLVDFDVVELSNLQRQVIHASDRVGMLKVESARQSLAALNPDCRVVTREHQLDDRELAGEIEAASIVLDCSDNFATRFQVNRQCLASSTPLVSAAAIRMEGQILPVLPGRGPCYQCLYPDSYEDMPTCEMEGVLGPVVGVMGTLQALQALLILTGNDEELVGRLTLFDALSMRWQQLQVPINPGCPACGGTAR